MTKTSVVIGDGPSGRLALNVPALIDSRMLVTASSGGGKSWLLRRLIELIAGQVQVIVIDPEGEFSTLREKFDLLLIGQSGEIKPEDRTAKLLARKLAELRASAVIDLYDLGDWNERRAYLAAFIDGLMSIPKALYHPIFIAIDESHMFAPESAGGSAGSPVALSRRAIAFLMSAGRKRAICAALATQRISKLDKDAIADAKNVFVGGITLDIDQRRAADMLGLAGREDRVALRDLKPGTFYAYGPALPSGVSKFTAGPVITTHPRPGERHRLEVPPASDAVNAILASLADLPQEVEREANELADLKRQAREHAAEISRLRAQLAERPVPALALPERIEIKIPIFKDGELDRLEVFGKQMAEAISTLDQISGLGEDLRIAVGEVSASADRAAKAALAAQARVIPEIDKALALAKREPLRSALEMVSSARHASPAKRLAADPGPSDTYRGDLTRPQARILDTLAWLESVRLTPADKSQVALLAGASPRSSAYTNNLGALRSAGLLSYPSAGRLDLTDAGRKRAQWPTIPPTSSDLQESILAKLSRPKAAILIELIASYPEALNKVDLAHRVNASDRSSAYTNNLGALRSLGLIDYPAAGLVKAQPVLFLRG